MIRIGLEDQQKINLIRSYCAEHSVEKVFIFYPRKFPLEIEVDRHVDWDEIIMYRTFYPLLETIDHKTLLIYNEIMRTRNRHELTYNCAHHYSNQAGHIIVFQHFPFIEEKSDFSVLLDLIDKPRYKSRAFSWDMLREQDIKVQPHSLEAESIDVQVNQKERKKYEAKKEQLFEELHEESDPDNIPRNLHVFASNFKKRHLDPKVFYVARNKRFKLKNVVTYKEIEPEQEYVIIDMPHRRIEFIDFLAITGQHTVRFIHTDLPVDRYYFSELIVWKQRLEDFYAQASIRQ